VRTGIIGAIYCNLLGYYWELHELLWPFFRGGGLFALLVVPLGISGYLLRARCKLSFLEIFVAFYCLTLLLWTSEFAVRFLIPIIPFWLYYIAYFVRTVGNRLGGRSKQALCAVLLALCTCSYASGYMRTSFGPIRLGLGDPEFQKTCQYIRDHVPPETAIVFSKPRLLTLLTDRRASAYYEAADDAELWKYFESISAGFILFDPEFSSDSVYLRCFIQRGQPRLSIVFADGKFRLYRVQPSH